MGFSPQSEEYNVLMFEYYLFIYLFIVKTRKFKVTLSYLFI